MPVTVLRHRDRIPTRWANGGGITYEALRMPAGDSPFDWRISFAEVATEGPFSLYPGIDRTLVVVDGAGMVLDMDGHQVDVPLHAPVHFAGEMPVVGLLPRGPVSDCNVMVRRGVARATVTVLDGSDRTVVAQRNATTIVAVLAGAWAMPDANELLGPRDCVVLDGDLALVGHGVLARIVIATM